MLRLLKTLAVSHAALSWVKSAAQSTATAGVISAYVAAMGNSGRSQFDSCVAPAASTRYLAPNMGEVWRCGHGFMETLDELIDRGPQPFRLECGVWGEFGNAINRSMVRRRSGRRERIYNGAFPASLFER